MSDATSDRLLRGVLAPLAAFLLPARAGVEIVGSDPVRARRAASGLSAPGTRARCSQWLPRPPHPRRGERSRTGGHIDAVLLRLGFGFATRLELARRSARDRGAAHQSRTPSSRCWSADRAGPRGSQARAITAARLAGVPVLPVGMSARPAASPAGPHAFAWPFARVRINMASR
jgi:hypothetical protein